MLIPRLFYMADGRNINDLKTEAIQWATGVGECIIMSDISKDHQETAANELKKICLFHNARLVVMNDISLAAKINADGILLNDPTMTLRARDILGTSHMIGTLADSIAEIADLNDEAVVDFIILGKLKSGSSMKLSSPPEFEIQRILDDSRIMGYNIPTLISFSGEQNKAESILRMGAYGLLYEDLTLQNGLRELIKQFPLK